MSVQVDPSLAGDLYCPACEKMFEEGENCPKDGARLIKLVAPVDPFLGRELDKRYTIVERIGQGGMGAVYRGTQHSVEREVAIKVVNSTRISSTEAIRRFLREAKLASRLNHPNAVGVVDFGQTSDGVFYLVMELIRGRTLDYVIKHDARFSPGRIVRIGRQVCDALSAAHVLGIVHRDLKPSNIMMLENHRDFAKVLDFGLAKSIDTDDAMTTMSGEALIGTPAFIPPEVARGLRCDGRADIYSLGCILYLLGAQRLPFESSSPHELVALHGTATAPPMTGVPEPLARVIDRMLEREPSNRYPSASDAREALEAALARMSSGAIEAQSVTPTPTPIPQSEFEDSQRPTRTEVDIALMEFPEQEATHTLARPIRSRRRWFAIGAIAALGLAIGSVVMITRSSSDAPSSAATVTPAESDPSIVAPSVAEPAPSEPAKATPPEAAESPPAAIAPVATESGPDDAAKSRPVRATKPSAAAKRPREAATSSPGKPHEAAKSPEPAPRDAPKPNKRPPPSSNEPTKPKDPELPF